MNRNYEKRFIKMPRLGARLYDRLTQLEDIRQVIRQIAIFLASRVESGRLLDVGTGPGQLLAEIHLLNPNIELYGLDISPSMVYLARQKLRGVKVDLRCGNIRETDFEDNTFDIVTCTGSLYLWDSPEQGLEEIHRILKEKGSAYLFEPYRDCDRKKVKESVRVNLSKANLFRKMLMPHALNKALSITYDRDEFAKIISRTRFANTFTIEDISLGNLPVWLRITLTKQPVGRASQETLEHSVRTAQTL